MTHLVSFHCHCRPETHLPKFDFGLLIVVHFVLISKILLHFHFVRNLSYLLQKFNFGCLCLHFLPGIALNFHFIGWKTRHCSDLFGSVLLLIIGRGSTENLDCFTDHCFAGLFDFFSFGCPTGLNFPPPKIHCLSRSWINFVLCRRSFANFAMISHFLG